MKNQGSRGNSPYSVMVTFWLTEDQKRRLDEVAEESRYNRSQVLRQLIDNARVSNQPKVTAKAVK